MRVPAMNPEPPSPRRRTRAIVTALILAAIAIGIYATVILEYVARG
jgi:hypothetical protein